MFIARHSMFSKSIICSILVCSFALFCISQVNGSQTNSSDVCALNNQPIPNSQVGFIKRQALDYMDVGNWNGAIRCFTKLINANFYKITCLSARAKCWHRLGNLEKTVADLNLAAQLEKRSALLSGC